MVNSLFSVMQKGGADNPWALQWQSPLNPAGACKCTLLAPLLPPHLQAQHCFPGCLGSPDGFLLIISPHPWPFYPLSIKWHVQVHKLKSHSLWQQRWATRMSVELSNVRPKGSPNTSHNIKIKKNRRTSLRLRAVWHMLKQRYIPYLLKSILHHFADLCVPSPRNMCKVTMQVISEHPFRRALIRGRRCKIGYWKKIPNFTW